MMLAPRIDPAAARAKLDSGQAVALDVTSSLVYPGVGHRIPGAIRIPPEPIIRGLQAARPPADILQHFNGVPPDREIIAYCT
ncbi:MAG TPA: rhodanese-like domain-containing protein [Candidatus Dormibacteraeota bacterium]|jgi:3-mercaptopyruvate sulfurtransferase SseA|nr:rhodanese-like domain-containing protein [Candidatus Dormibacteraeota bacterium]